jgi:hypothetical protein
MKRMIPFSILATLLMLIFLCGCDNDTTNDVGDGGGNPPPVTDMTCLGCHSSEEMLRDALGGEKDAEIKVANKDDG